MKITIDNTLKTIEIEQDVNISELIDALNDLGIEWEEYKIVATKVIYYTSPCYPQVIEIPCSPPYNPWITTPFPYPSYPVITCSL